MKGASALTVVASIRIKPNTQRNTANGSSQRLSESLRHIPRARSPIEPAALPNRIKRRRTPPGLLIMRELPPSGNGPSNVHARSEEHTSELQSQSNLVCRLLLEKKKQ